MNHLPTWWPTGFAGELLLVVAAIGALVFILMNAPAAIGLGITFGAAYFGHLKAGVWGTAAGLVVGGFVGMIAYAITDQILEDRRKSDLKAFKEGLAGKGDPTSAPE